MKCLHTTSEDPNQCYALDYRPDGLKFATAGQDYQVDVYHVCVCVCGWVGGCGVGVRM